MSLLLAHALGTTGTGQRLAWHTRLSPTQNVQMGTLRLVGGARAEFLKEKENK